MNNHFIADIEKAGMKVSGYSAQNLVETMGIPSHSFFVAVQFHPESTSSPRGGHPLFRAFVEAGKKKHLA